MLSPSSSCPLFLSSLCLDLCVWPHVQHLLATHQQHLLSTSTLNSLACASASPAPPAPPAPPASASCLLTHICARMHIRIGLVSPMSRSHQVYGRLVAWSFRPLLPPLLVHGILSLTHSLSPSLSLFLSFSLSLFRDALVRQYLWPNVQGSRSSKACDRTN